MPSTTRQDWVDTEQDELAFCRVTQMAFLRLLTNPAVTQRDVLSRRQAWEVFEKLIADPRIRFIAESPGIDTLWIAFSKRHDKSHLLWTDDYIAAFAQSADAELVTLINHYPSATRRCKFCACIDGELSCSDLRASRQR